MRLFPVEIDNLSVLASPVRLGGSRHKYSLQNIGLSLGVIPIQNIGALVKLHGESIIIPVICQFY